MPPQVPTLASGGFMSGQKMRLRLATPQSAATPVGPRLPWSEVGTRDVTFVANVLLIEAFVLDDVAHYAYYPGGNRRRCGRTVVLAVIVRSEYGRWRSGNVE